MKKIIPILLAAALFVPVLLLYASKTQLKTYNKDNISGKELSKRLFTEGKYQDFLNWPGYEGFQKGRKAHGSYFKLYMSPELSTARPLKKAEAPEGTIIVKEVFDKNKKKVEQVLVMVKVKGFDTKNNDWYWASYDKDGKEIEAGKLRSCAACHAQGKDNDFVLSRMLK